MMKLELPLGKLRKRLTMVVRRSVEVARKQNEQFFFQEATDKRALERADSERREKEKAALEKRRRELIEVLDDLNEQVADAEVV